MKIFKIVILFFILFSCTTTVPKETKETKKTINLGCFNFIIPEKMEESPDEAKKYRYKILLVDKDKQYYNSSVMIAIREKKNSFNDTLKEFAEMDQIYLQKSVSVIYEDEWIPAGFTEKNINHISYQFKYTYGYEIIYQRSVYLECADNFYVISLSSVNKINMLDEKNDLFWKNITINP
jgi:hypothetical protein